jgi:hypothetical protein
VLRACRAFERVHPVCLPDMAKLPHRVSQGVP